MPNTGSAVLDQDFEPFGESTIDERKRITLTKAVEALRDRFNEELAKIRFAIYVNKAGQILLSPEAAIPLHEAWLFKNQDALRRVLLGIQEANEGKLEYLGSFADVPENDEED